MNDFELRQIELAFAVIGNYFNQQITLNSTVHDLEALMSHLQLNDEVRFSDTLADIEVINAFLVEERRKPTSEEAADIQANLDILKSILLQKKRSGQ